MASFYADEDVPGPLTAALRALGHDVLTVQADGRAGGDDPAVLARATELGRTVLTKNRRHFFALHAADPNHPGIVTFTDDPDRPSLAARIDAAVAPYPSLAGLLIRVTRPNPPQVP